MSQVLERDADHKGYGIKTDNSVTDTSPFSHSAILSLLLRQKYSKDPSKYTEDQLAHMHKVVAYCARHLAQEAHMVEEKSEEELQKTKSYRSLKNWGHDSLLAEGESGKKNEQTAAEGDKGKSETKEESNGKGKGKGKGKAADQDEGNEQQEEKGGDSDDEEDGYQVTSGTRKRKQVSVL